MNQGYFGPERRQHSMYVTRNTEYHFRGNECVAVRDRRTRQWLAGHLALRRRLSGGIRITIDGTCIPTLEAPGVGEALYFGDDGRELITSALSEVSRPERDVVRAYPESQPNL
jgi:hypothetical protein